MNSKVTSYKALLSQPQYLKLMLANIVSRFGDSLDAIAFSWVMYEVTGNASLIALILALNYLPTIFLQPFLGVLAERCSKKKIMVLCDLGRGIAVTGTALLYFFGLLAPWMLIVITLTNSTLESIRQPAGNAILPHILEKDKYTVGMALSQTLVRVFELVGMGLAGGIIALWGSHTALLIDAATFVISAAAISWIRYTEQLETEPLSAGLFQRKLTEGFRYLHGNRTLFLLILLGASLNFALAPLSSFQSIYTAEVLGMGPEILSVIGIALTAGMGLGAFVTPKLLKQFQVRTLILAAGELSAVTLAGFWLAPLLPGIWPVLGVLAAATLLLGGASGVISVLFGSSFTAMVDSSYLARISAITNSMLLSISPLSALLCSVMAYFLPIPVIFLIFAVIMGGLFLAAGFVKEYGKL